MIFAVRCGRLPTLPLEARFPPAYGSLLAPPRHARNFIHLSTVLYAKTFQGGSVSLLFSAGHRRKKNPSEFSSVFHASRLSALLHTSSFRSCIITVTTKAPARMLRSIRDTRHRSIPLHYTFVKSTPCCLALPVLCNTYLMLCPADAIERQFLNTRENNRRNLKRDHVFWHRRENQPSRSSCHSRAPLVFVESQWDSV